MKIEVTGTFFVGNLRHLRRRYALSYRALGKLIGMDATILQTILQESRLPIFTRQQLVHACAVFNLPLEDLIHTDLTR